ncbi:hypothetical protein AB0I16_33255 [Streptomyces sp. NPDC050703]|uniref:hypothetical protein n=1 Tax=Streptomyces sp. NPDC050703 TaxID=3157218 RepID=UPI00343FF0E4
MPAKKTDAPDADALTSEVHTAIDALKALDPSAKDTPSKADALKREADSTIRKLPAERRNTLRTEVRNAHKAAKEAPVASKAVEARPAPQTTVYADDPLAYEGVPELVADGVKEFKAGLALGLKLGNVGERLARILLDTRLAIRNPDAGNLPDLMADRKTTKNAANLVYSRVRKAISDDDQKQLDAHGALVRATQNKASDVLVDWLHSFDTSDRAEAAQIALELFPGVEKHLNDDAPVSEAIRAVYAAHDVTLPRYGRTELARIDRRLKKLDAATKDLEALQDADDADASDIAKLEDTISDLKAEIPADVLEKRSEPEKTDAERATEAIDAAKAQLSKAGKRFKKVRGADKRKAKAQMYVIIREMAEEFELDLSALVPSDDA